MKKGLEVGRTLKIEPMKKMVGPLAPTGPRRGGPGLGLGNAVVIALLSLAFGAVLGVYGKVLVAEVAALLRLMSAILQPGSFDTTRVVGSAVKK
jgi:hypothetical protein